MRARHRHFNAKDVGASVALDSRFGFNLADGDSVSTWINRIGSNNATEATNRPIYKTQIQGGQPVIRYNGTSSKLSTPSFTTNSGLVSLVIVCRRNWTTAKYSTPIAQGVTSTLGLDGISVVVTGGTAQDWLTKDIQVCGSGSASIKIPRTGGSYGSISDGTSQILTSILSNAKTNVLLNGTTIKQRGTVGTIPSTTAAFQVGWNTAYGDYFDGDIMNVTFVPLEFSESQRKRIEHSNAFSFKITCS